MDLIYAQKDFEKRYLELRKQGYTLHNYIASGDDTIEDRRNIMSLISKSRDTVFLKKPNNRYVILFKPRE